MTERLPAPRVLAMIVVGLLSASVLAADAPARLRVTGIEWNEGARLDAEIVQGCEVERVLARNFSLARAKTPANRNRAKQSVASATDVVVRIDRIARLSAQPPPRPTPPGIELAITLRAVGDRPVDQPFACREATIAAGAAHPQCVRLDRCARRLADQVATWLESLAQLKALGEPGTPDGA